GNNRQGIREGKFERTHAWVLVHRELGSAELYPPGLAGYLADERNRTDSTTGSWTGPEPLQNPAQRRRGKLRLAIEKGILGEAGVAFEGECGGRRLECDGEARGSASEQKERRGNRKINANAFAMPYASGRNRCVGVEGRPFRLAVEAGDDGRILAVDDAYDPAVANLQRSDRSGRQRAGARLGWIGLDHSAGGVHRAGDAAARGNGRCKQPVRAPLDPESGPDEMGCLEHDVATQGCKGGKVDLDAFGLHHWRRVRLGPFRKRHVGQYGAEFRPHLDLRRAVYVHPEAAP